MEIPTPEQIFDEVIKGTSHFNANSYEDDVAFTSGVFGLFSSLGKSLGYLIIPENSKKGEFLTVDLLWKNNEDIILALEHENNPRNNPIEDEWRKLVNIKANLKILISYQSNPDQRKKWIKRAEQIIGANSLKLEKETYMLILGSTGKGKTGKDPFVRYHAFIFDNLGHKRENFHSSNIPLKTNYSQSDNYVGF